MLHENAFVEFWGRIRKIKEGAEGGNGMKVNVGSEDLAGEEDNEEGEKADLKSLARNIDVKEIERVLKVMPTLGLCFCNTIDNSSTE